MLYRNAKTGQEVEAGDAEGAKVRWLERAGFKPVGGKPAQPKSAPDAKPAAATTDSPPNLNAAAPVDLKPAQVGNAPEAETKAQAKAKKEN